MMLIIYRLSFENFVLKAAKVAVDASDNVSVGCRSACGCCSGAPWPCSCSGRTQSRVCRKIQMLGPQTPDQEGCWV